MSKVVYVGPTIPGIADRNVVYSSVPKAITDRVNEAPFLTGLCVPISDLPSAMRQIEQKRGSIFTFYKQALEFGATH